MLLYVAGEYGKRARLHEIMMILQGLGHEITYDWTQAPDTISRREQAKNDKLGVTRANAVVVFMNDPNYAYKGSWTEVGIALATGKPIFFVTTEEFMKTCKNVFLHDPLITIRFSLAEVVMNLGIPNFKAGQSVVDVLKEHGIIDFVF